MTVFCLVVIVFQISSLQSTRKAVYRLCPAEQRPESIDISQKATHANTSRRRDLYLIVFFLDAGKAVFLAWDFKSADHILLFAMHIELRPNLLYRQRRLRLTRYLLANPLFPCAEPP